MGVGPQVAPGQPYQGGQFPGAGAPSGYNQYQQQFSGQRGGGYMRGKPGAPRGGRGGMPRGGGM